MLAGNGPVFNVGERVEGYSSPLWLLLIVLGRALGVGAEQASQGLGVACLLGTSALLYGYGRSRFGASPLAACIPLAFLAAPANVLNATLGFETPLVALLLVLVVLLSREGDRSPRNDLAIGMAFCALSLSRPEAVAYYLTFLILEVVRLRGHPGSLPRLVRIASGLVPFVAFVAWRLLYYGHPMPNTFYAKVGFASASFHDGLVYLLDYVEGHAGGCLFLAIVVAARILQRPLRWDTPLALIGCGAVLTVLSGGNNLPGWRYAAPLGGLVAIVVTDFLATGSRMALRASGARGLGIGLVSVTLFVHSLSSGAVALVGRDEVRSVIANNYAFAASARFHAELFSQLLQPQHSIALNAVPLVAYYFPGRIIDMLGLVDESIAHRKVSMGRRIRGHEKGDGRYVLAQRPTLIILAGGPYLSKRPITGYPRPADLYYLSEREIAASDDFQRLYEPVSLGIGGRFSNFYRLKSEQLGPISTTKSEALYREMLANAVPSSRAQTRDSLARAFAKVCDEGAVRGYLALRTWMNFSGMSLAGPGCAR